MSFVVLGWGTAVPPHAIDQGDAATLAAEVNCRTEKQRRFLREAYLHAGVERRHSCILAASDGPLAGRQTFFPPPTSEADRGPGTAARLERYREEAPALALAAARRALDEAAIDPHRITHLVTASCTGFHAPGFDIELAEQLPLRADVARTHIGFMGCHAALNALRVAQAFAAGPGPNCVLVACVELCGLHHQYGWSAEQIVANALFADGAAAFVGREASAEDDARHWRLAASGSTIVAGTQEEMSWTIGDHGFAMTLSRALPATIGRHLRPWLEEWLARCELTVDGIASWAIHPGGPRILTACEEALRLSDDRLAVSRDVLRTHGNMSSPTLLFILEQLVASGAPRPCVALAFGPGLTIEAALFR